MRGRHDIRTGKGGRFRCYACSIKARQGETGCKGRAIPMDRLDHLVAGYIEHRLLDHERLEEVQETILGRREEQCERRRVHIAELNRRAAESELRLKRLYGAIEAGVADLDDLALKERIAGLKVIRDQSRVDADRALAMLDRTGERAITPEMFGRLSGRARADAARQGRLSAGSTCARSPSASRSATTRFASWDRRATCSGRWSPRKEGNRRE